VLAIGQRLILFHARLEQAEVTLFIVHNAHIKLAVDIITAVVQVYLCCHGERERERERERQRDGESRENLSRRINYSTMS
jgi:hypothetical protein